MFQSDIDGLIRRQQSGWTLEQAFYRSPEIYQLEFQQVLSPQWLYVEHESELVTSSLMKLVKSPSLSFAGSINNCGHFLTSAVTEDPRSV